MTEIHKDEDDLWLTMKDEAASDVYQESNLVNGYVRSILSAHSMASGLASHLSMILGNTPNLSLSRLIRRTLEEDQEILRAIKDDLRASKERDPVFSSYADCFLFSKFFLACQAHKLADKLCSQDTISLDLIKNRVSEVFPLDIPPGAKLDLEIMLDDAAKQFYQFNGLHNPFSWATMTKNRGEEVDEGLWQMMKDEARSFVDQEPSLETYYSNTIFAHGSMKLALANHLSMKLTDPSLSSGTLRECFMDILTENQEIVSAAQDDLRALKERHPAFTSYVDCFLNFKGFLACQAHRIAHKLWSLKRRVLAFCIQTRVSEVFKLDIHPAAKIGRGIILDDATGVDIGGSAVIGNNVSILHNVTFGDGDWHSKIGDGAVIVAGTSGNIRIGDTSSLPNLVGKFRMGITPLLPNLYNNTRIGETSSSLPNLEDNASTKFSPDIKLNPGNQLGKSCKRLNPGNQLGKSRKRLRRPVWPTDNIAGELLLTSLRAGPWKECALLLSSSA